jgi:hypothetical protein
MLGQVPGARPTSDATIVDRGAAMYYMRWALNWGLGGFGMFKRFALVAALFAFSGLLPSYGATSPMAAAEPAIIAQSLPPLFSTEGAAQTHCPRDVVVWLNIPSGIYHYKGERWYGRTKHGAYACEKEAKMAGDRASLNGQ